MKIFLVCTTLGLLTLAYGIIDNSNSNILNKLETELSVPYQVSVQDMKKNTREYEHLCAGTIIDEEIVLTAAHCFYQHQQPEDLSVVGGSNILSTTSGERYQVTAMNLHEYYEPLYGRDIALLKVSPKFVLDGQKYGKISFNATLDKDVKQNGYLLGWGQNKVGKVQQLEQISFQTLDTARCWQKGFNYVTSTDMCAISVKGRGACDGDSGGPLMSTDLSVQLGILSYGRETCQPGKIYVFTAIHPLRGWIQEHMNKLKKRKNLILT